MAQRWIETRFHSSPRGRFDLSFIHTQEMRSRVMAAMREGFRPEFLNRIDEFVIFDRLSVEYMRQISGLELKKVTLRLADKDITLEATDAALDFISSVGYDPTYGARPLKRTIQREVETVLAKRIISGDISMGDVLVADVINERLVIASKGAATEFSPAPTPPLS